MPSSSACVNFSALDLGGQRLQLDEIVLFARQGVEPSEPLRLVLVGPERRVARPQARHAAVFFQAAISSLTARASASGACQASPFTVDSLTSCSFHPVCARRLVRRKQSA